MLRETEKSQSDRLNSEAELHNFYQSQVESILKEKVGELQSHVQGLVRVWSTENS